MTLGNVNDLGRFHCRLYLASREASATQLTRSRGSFTAAGSPSLTTASDPAASRARSKVRRFTTANDLASMVTCTFRSEPTAAQTKRAMKNMLRRMQSICGVFPYLWVPERGDGHARLHTHLLLPTALAGSAREQWIAGWTHLRSLEGVEAQRKCAHYLAKGFKRPVLASRYFLARGFAPVSVSFEVSSIGSFVDVASDTFGKRPIDCWRGDRLGAGITAYWL